MADNRFHLDHRGIGKVLKDSRLIVPPNQRAYAWSEEEVIELFQDLSQAVRKNEPDYFLGTIVLTQGEGGVLLVSDGQQRLATVTILLACIRDHFLAQGKKPKADSIDNDFLRGISLETDETLPKLRLNVDDHEYYRNLVLERPDDRKKLNVAHRSNERLNKAVTLAKEHIKDILAPYKPENYDSILVGWVKYLEERATVGVVVVPSEVDAFRMFETLNDRGLRASQADILKNFLLGKARHNLPNAQLRWASISGAIETISDERRMDLVTYIRHYWITRHGQTKERELAESIKKEINSETDAMDFLAQLEDSVSDYVSLFNMAHAKWSKYKGIARESVKVIVRDLRVEQIRPLLFAVSRHFNETEAEKAFRMLVSWSVRFLIVGGRGGMLDAQYANRAHEIGAKKVTTAAELREKMKPYVPTDKSFQEEFSRARVSQQWVARYYLRTLDLEAKGVKDPELTANEDADTINLEHIMPLLPGPDWRLPLEVIEQYDKRLGNMTLLKAKTNVALGNASFEEKKKQYAQSTYKITSLIGESAVWGPQEIEERQKWMAELAVKIWLLK